MKKAKLIEWAKYRLAEIGITDEQYVISLQGPTVIFCAGVKILDLDTRVDLIKAGVQLIGGY